jgi:hypothetical protein
VPNHDVRARAANNFSANCTIAGDATVRVVTRRRDRGGKTGAHFLDCTAAVAARKRVRIETNNNMGGLIRVDDDNVVPDECWVAIEPTALHKRGRLNNQSSNILDLVVGQLWTFLEESECFESIISIVFVASALFVLSVALFEPNGERHHGQEGKATRVD